jgi:nitronate monooxygenase
MWPRPLLDLLHVEHPILGAPMAGGPSTPALAAAVSEAGGLGALAAGYLAADAVRQAIRATRALTRRPFQVNFFAPSAGAGAPAAAALAEATAALAALRAELGLGGEPPFPPPPSFGEQLAAVLEEEVPVVSFTFGPPPADALRAFAARGTVVLGTATSAAEARALETAGVQAVVAQGAEAGGHRGTFLGPPERSLLPTLALVPLVAGATRLPVVAAGGIMDGRGIAAALALGASGAALGTAFLASPESGAHPAYKAAVLAARQRDGDPTALTEAFTGRLARGLANRFTEAMAGAAHLPYPLQHWLTVELRAAAARAGRADLMSCWAGQAVALATDRPAGQLVAELVAETREALRRLGRAA